MMVMNHRMSQGWRWIYTGCIIFNLLADGIGNNLIGPAMIDLQHVYAAPVEAMSYLASFLALGYMLGSLIGWAMPLLNRQITIAGFLILEAVSLAAMPHCGRIGWLYVVAVAYGIGGGAFDASFTVWLVEMWPDQNGPFLQTAQLAFGVGMIIGPLADEPFIYGGAINTTTTTLITPEVRRWSLCYPFSFAGLVQLIVPLILLATYLIKPYHNAPKAKSQINDNLMLEGGATQKVVHSMNQVNETYRKCSTTSGKLSRGEDTIPYRKIKLLLATLSLAGFGALGATVFSFLAVALQFLPIAMSANEAALVVSLVAVTFSLGKVFAIFLSFRLSPDTLLAVHHSIIATGIALLYFGCDHVKLIYIGSSLLGLGFSVIWASMFSFTEYHLRLTDAICSVFSFVVGLLTLLVPIMMGRGLESEPRVLFYAAVACEALSLIAFVVLKVLVVIAPRRI